MDRHLRQALEDIYWIAVTADGPNGAVHDLRLPMLAIAARSRGALEGRYRRPTLTEYMPALGKR